VSLTVEGESVRLAIDGAQVLRDASLVASFSMSSQLFILIIGALVGMSYRFPPPPCVRPAPRSVTQAIVWPLVWYPAIIVLTITILPALW
jgi:hypothetical protein